MILYKGNIEKRYLRKRVMTGQNIRILQTVV